MKGFMYLKISGVARAWLVLESRMVHSRIPCLCFVLFCFFSFFFLSILCCLHAQKDSLLVIKEGSSLTFSQVQDQ